MKKIASKSSAMNRWLPRICFGVAFVCLVIFCGVSFIQMRHRSQPAPPAEAAATPQAARQTPEPTLDPWGKNQEGILNIYAPYYEENPDMIGWLNIPGTEIDYPVMQTPGNNEKYLRKGFDGSYSEAGTLFLDEHCSAGPKAYTANLMIYGHDMNDGTMFGNLEEYADPEYGKEHKIIWFDTIYDRGEYQLLAAFYSKVYYTTDTCFKYYQFFDAKTPTEFENYIDGITSLAEYDTGVTAEYGDILLTLSTCSTHVENGRFVVVAKKVG